MLARHLNRNKVASLLGADRYKRGLALLDEHRRSRRANDAFVFLFYEHFIVARVEQQHRIVGVLGGNFCFRACNRLHAARDAADGSIFQLHNLEPAAEWNVRLRIGA